MSTPPPGPPATTGTTGTGMNKKTASFLAYFLVWIGGVIFLFVGKNDPDIKFHAARSIVTFLPIQIVWFLVGLVPGVVGVILYWVFAIGYIVLWVLCWWRAWSGNGERFEIPVLSGVVDGFAEQLAAKV